MALVKWKKRKHFIDCSDYRICVTYHGKDRQKQYTLWKLIDNVEFYFSQKWERVDTDSLIELKKIVQRRYDKKKRV